MAVESRLFLCFGGGSGGDRLLSDRREGDDVEATAESIAVPIMVRLGWFWGVEDAEDEEIRCVKILSMSTPENNRWLKLLKTLQFFGQFKPTVIIILLQMLLAFDKNGLVFRRYLIRILAQGIAVIVNVLVWMRVNDPKLLEEKFSNGPVDKNVLVHCLNHGYPLLSHITD